MGVNAFDRLVIMVREEAESGRIHVLELPMGPLLAAVDSCMGFEDVTDWGVNRSEVAELARREAYRRETAEREARSAALIIQARARFFRPDAA